MEVGVAYMTRLVGTHEEAVASYQPDDEQQHSCLVAIKHMN